jgi:hypothetical protein
VGPLESFTEHSSSPQVCLLGDAVSTKWFANISLSICQAHAMLPSFASGAGTAIEDAFVLGSALATAFSTPTKTAALSRASVALRVFDKIRQPLATYVQNQSRALARVYSFIDIPEDEPVESIKRRVEGMWSWCRCQLHRLYWLLTRMFFIQPRRTQPQSKLGGL